MSNRMIMAVCNTFFFNPSSGPKFNSAMRGKIGLPHSMKIRFCFLSLMRDLMVYIDVYSLHNSVFFFTADVDLGAKVLSEKTRVLSGRDLNLA